MSTPDIAPTREGAFPLSTIQRHQLRVALVAQWHETVNRITELSIRFHSEDGSTGGRTDLDQRLAANRQVLVEVESALRRLESGSYGRCYGCERRIPFERLEVRPHQRFCVVCSGHGAGADG